MSAPSADDTPLLQVRGLCAGYGLSQVLFDVNLDLRSGEIIGLLGRNGMGKTTLVRSVLGLVQPMAGSVHWQGRALAGLPVHQVARLGLALVPEGRQVFANLTVEDRKSVV